MRKFMPDGDWLVDRTLDNLVHRLDVVRQPDRQSTGQATKADAAWLLTPKRGG
jgi:hypothetical protein